MREGGRRSIRLPGYDYAQPGAYFITLVTHHRAALFGEIVNGEMVLNTAGRIVREEWERSAGIRCEITLDAFVIMPNHIHGIVMISGDGRGDRPVAPTDGSGNPVAPTNPTAGPAKRSLGAFIAGFKSAVTQRINAGRGTPGAPVWQRNYYEHIIRDAGDLDRLRRYIADNPAGWAADTENLALARK